MDIKSLYDAACDAGINWELEAQDVVGDLHDPWVAACLDDADWLADHADEVMSYMDMPLLADAGQATAQANADRDFLTTRLKGPGSLMADAYANSLVGRLARIGAIFARALTEMAEDEVRRSSYDWLADCAGYHRDMEAGRAEDAAIRAFEMRRDD